MNWWADLGGWLGLGISWTPADYAIFAIALPLLFWAAVRLGLWHMHNEFEKMKHAKKKL